MTEAEVKWLQCTNPSEMLETVMYEASDRKLRLFACACCRRIWHLLADWRSRNALEVAERFADGQVDKNELEAAFDAANTDDDGGGNQDPYELTNPLALAAAGAASPNIHAAIEISAFEAARGWAEACESAAGDDREALFQLERSTQSNLLRDLVGCPFRPISGDPSWQSPTVVSLAQTIYNERAFDCLPILADALEDAGCDNADILTHCRLPGKHARGCWVLDLLLGKK